MYKSKQIQNLCLSILIAGFWLIFAVKTLPMVFMTNDDTAIQVALSGMQTGQPYPYHQFINSILGFVIAAMYNITTAVPWWYAWSIFCMLIGIVFIQWAILNNASNKIEKVLFIAVFGLAFWIYSLGNIAFTIVPCILSLGCIILLFSNDKPKWNHFLIFLCCFFLVISYLHRSGTGLVMLCYFAMALLYFTSCCTNLGLKQKIFRYVGTMLLMCVVIVASTVIDSNLKEQRNSAEFTEYNNARVAYMDYPHVSYDDNPEVYQSYGWDRSLAALVSSWCFLDERVNAESFLGISNAKPLYNDNNISEIETNVVIEEPSFFEPLNSLLETNKYALYLAYISVFICIFGELYIGECGLFKSKLNLFYVLNIIGSVILLLYLILNKRLPLRVYMIVLIPMILISCLLLMKVHRESKDKHSVFWNFYLVVLLLLAISSLLYNYESDSITAKVKSIENCNAIDDYLLEHSHNIYIADFGAYSSIYPFGQVASNMYSWGGSTYHSEFFNLHLQKNGLSKLNMETLKNDNAYMLTAASKSDECSSTVGVLFDCLVAYGAIGVQKVDTINGTCDVYKFIFDEKLNGYTGFYKIGKNRYYYVDGIRQTEDFSLDGDEYKCGDNNLVWNGKYWVNSIGYIEK